jgi:hypothetical protein
MNSDNLVQSSTQGRVLKLKTVATSSAKPPSEDSQNLSNGI